MSKLLFSLVKAMVPSVNQHSQAIPGSTLGWLGLKLRLPNPHYNPPPSIRGQQFRVGPFVVDKRLPQNWYKLAMPSACSGPSIFHRNQLQFIIEEGGENLKNLKKRRFRQGDHAFIRVYNTIPKVDVSSIVSHRRVTNGYRLKIIASDGTKQEIRGSCLHARVARELRQYAHTVRHDSRFSAYVDSKLQKMTILRRGH